MDREQTMAEIVRLTDKKHQMLVRLEQPARQALAQMLDAGMKHGAEGLKVLLYEIDVVDSEVRALLESDPTTSLAAFRELLNRRRA